MKTAKIKFVRIYNQYGSEWFDVIYTSGRCVTMKTEDMPKTVRAFVDNAKSVKEQYCKIFKRTEFIYE